MNNRQLHRLTNEHRSNSVKELRACFEDDSVRSLGSTSPSHTQHFFFTLPSRTKKHENPILVADPPQVLETELQLPCNQQDQSDLAGDDKQVSLDEDRQREVNVVLEADLQDAGVEHLDSGVNIECHVTEWSSRDEEGTDGDEEEHAIVRLQVPAKPPREPVVSAAWAASDLGSAIKFLLGELGDLRHQGDVLKDQMHRIHSLIEELSSATTPFSHSRSAPSWSPMPFSPQPCNLKPNFLGRQVTWSLGSNNAPYFGRSVSCIGSVSEASGEDDVIV